jgi:O2-independent ubiquinone biosynthesis accessory factor UbiT
VLFLLYFKPSALAVLLFLGIALFNVFGTLERLNFTKAKQDKSMTSSQAASVPQFIKKRMEPLIKAHCLAMPSRAIKLVKCLPEKAQQAMLEKFLNVFFETAMQNGDIDFLDGHWLKVVVSDIPYEFFVSYCPTNAHGLVIKFNLNLNEDVTFGSDSTSLVQLISRNTDPDTLFFQRKLLVTGDTELGLEIKNFLDDLDLDRVPKPIISGLAKYDEWAKESR